MNNLSNKEVELLIKKSNKLVGLRQVLKHLLDGTIKCVIVSIDSDSFIYDTIKEKSSNINMPIYKNFKSIELGKLCQIDVPCAVVGILSN